MAHRRLGREHGARTWYDKSVAWMEKNSGPAMSGSSASARGAAALLGRNDLPADVFAGPWTCAMPCAYGAVR